MKKLFIILGGLLAVAIVVVIVLAFSLGSVVKTAINKVGPQLTQSKVELANASISPFSGEGTLSGLTIGNPAGWQTPNAFVLGKIALAVDTKSLKADHVVINTIEIDAPEITYEAKGLTDSNLKHLQRNIEQATTGGQAKQDKPSGDPAPRGDQPKETKPAGEPAPETKIEIKRLRFTNAKVTVMGFGQSRTVTIPSIAMDDLGTREGGLTAAQLSREVMMRIIAQVAEVALKSAPGEQLLDRAREKGNDLLNRALGGKKE